MNRTAPRQLTTAERVGEEIRAALAGLAPSRLVLHDETAMHQGHAGARDGGGHYRLELESEHFSGMSQVARHRAVYTALQHMMGHSIHALAIQARAPGEAATARQPDKSSIFQS